MNLEVFAQEHEAFDDGVIVTVQLSTPFHQWEEDVIITIDNELGEFSIKDIADFNLSLDSEDFLYIAIEKYLVVSGLLQVRAYPEWIDRLSIEGCIRNSGFDPSIQNEILKYISKRSDRSLTQAFDSAFLKLITRSGNSTNVYELKVIVKKTAYRIFGRIIIEDTQIFFADIGVYTHEQINNKTGYAYILSHYSQSEA